MKSTASIAVDVHELQVSAASASGGVFSWKKVMLWSPLSLLFVYRTDISIKPSSYGRLQRCSNCARTRPVARRVPQHIITLTLAVCVQVDV